MARGDATIGITANVASLAVRDVQPSSGVEFLIHRASFCNERVGSAPNGVGDVAVFIYDGTSEAPWTSAASPEDSAALVSVPLHFHTTNSVYLRARNRAAEAATLAHTGTEVK